MAVGVVRERWDLERFFRGGSESEAYVESIQILEHDVLLLKKRLIDTISDSSLSVYQFLTLLSDF